VLETIYRCAGELADVCEVVRLLCDAGADANVRCGRLGLTALGVAVLCAHFRTSGRSEEGCVALTLSLTLTLTLPHQRALRGEVRPLSAPL